MNTLHIYAFLLLSFWISGGAPHLPASSKILKDALSWMTFRRNGVLLSDTDVKSMFFRDLENAYRGRNSEVYRAFVIAFEKGVVPRLTLNENEACDPAYTLEYKNPFSKSVDYHHQKKFTFKSYEDRKKTDALQFCDYRQGLVCKPFSKRCECPEGSSMQPILPGSPVRRCLLEQDEICALIDLDHGTDPNYYLLKGNLYHLIFNLEKPPSCQDGTQCRFKDTSKNFPKCYPNSAAPWPTPSDPGHREECALGLLATPGSCKKADSSDDKWPFKDFTCFDFGPLQSLQPGDPGFENKIGFCFDKFGPYSVSYDNSLNFFDYFMRPFFIAAVHPRTVPLRGQDLQNYYNRYLEDVAPFFSSDAHVSIVDAWDGDRCNVAKTQKMVELWKWFTSLEAAPPPGQDYVDSATPAELNQKLDEMVDLTTKASEKKICQVFRTYDDFSENKPKNYGLALECVTTPPTDSDGNDGICQESPQNEAVSKAFVFKILGFRDYIFQINGIDRTEKTVYNIDQIMEDNTCSTSVAPLVRHHNPDPLENRYCPMGFVCHLDFSDEHDLYINYGCTISSSTFQIPLCHEISNLKYGKCEDFHLSSRVQQVFKNLEDYAERQNGDDCDYQLAKAMRAKDFDNVKEWNLYFVLNWTERKSLCDSLRHHVECGESGKCECKKGSKCKGGDGGGGGGLNKHKKSGGVGVIARKEGIWVGGKILFAMLPLESFLMNGVSCR